MKKDIIKKVLGKIKKEQITPVPKWHFMIKSSFLWVIMIISIILGSFSFGFILIQMKDVDWDVRNILSMNFFEFLIFILPYFWAISMAMFLGLAVYNFIHTKKGYKYSIFVIIGLSFLVSLLLGAGFYQIGVSERFDDHLSLRHHFPMMMDARNRLWMNPKEGLLAGRIVEVVDEKTLIILNDMNQKRWKVNIENASFEKEKIPKIDMRIKLIGKKVSDDEFTANEVRSFKKKKERFHE